jgi:hypothetical protein
VIDLHLLDEFVDVTVPLGDFGFHRLYLVNHAPFLMCAIVAHERKIDARTKKHKDLLASVKELAAALMAAMQGGDSEQKVSCYVLAWGNPSMTSVYARHSVRGDPWRPETGNSPIGVKEVVAMEAADLKAHADEIVGALENSDVPFTRIWTS